ncbi:TRAP transporter large permease subunit [Burkholderia sp. Ax-1719]|uniref:TRAP transporter large permease n=1 Tax=Burkholderia sp. Ax-1719 TaxID=2608334 RepID=UPI001423CADD|nr:TRAP transporter large permease subunit [Burkholderia sp. Ax-1719]NIE66866.1 TRAP transporter large permease subunit [Burkholderia sp. Ax-1719]
MRVSPQLSAPAPTQAAPPKGGLGSVFFFLDRAIGTLVETAAALLVVTEIVLLMAGIVARYALHDPLTWSDELASLLFLWLAMFGAVVALRRGEHMRMSSLVSRMKPDNSALFEAIAVVCSLIFLLLILVPAYDSAENDAIMTLPATGISQLWRTAALPVGAVLMAITAVVRLFATVKPMTALKAVLVCAVISGILILTRSQLTNLGALNLLVFFVVLMGAAVLAGVPIAFSFGLSTLAYLTLTTSTPSDILVGRMAEGMSHLILLSVPLFVFLGLLIEMTGMAQRLVAFLASLLGHTRGGLSYVLIGAMYLVSGISGSKAADMAAIAPALFPEMRKQGCKPGELVALLSASGAQTETIPPSLVLITIGSVTGVSITALFTGGILPAVVVGVFLCAMVWYRNKKMEIAKRERASGRAIWRTFVIALPAIFLPFLIRFAVVEGIATATEVSTIGIAYTAITGLFLYRQFEWKRIVPMLIDSASLSGAILLIIGAATGMAWALTQSGFSDALAQAAQNLPGGRLGFLAASIVGFIILGSVLEGIPAVVLFGPLLFPVAQMVGIHEVHYAMVVILSMGIGLFMPPFGVGYYSACAVGKVNPNEGIGPMLQYSLALLAGVLIIAVVPWFSMGFLK